MPEAWSPPPIAVVALGDPARCDDGIALRVMGRARTLIGEIGCTRRAGPPRRIAGPEEEREHRAPAGSGAPQPFSLTRGPAGRRSLRAALALDSHQHRAGLIEWIEGGTDPQKLDPVLAGRRRVVLIDAVRMTGKPGQVHHWHLRCLPQSRLSVVRRFSARAPLTLHHLALWLEDDLPARGTDLIGIEPADLSEGEGLSRTLRQRLPSISSQVAAILIRLLDEEGW